MKFWGFNRFLYVLIILVAVTTFGLSSVVAQPAENEKTADAFPVPSANDGAELLRYENITFEADANPMLDIAATVRSARKNEEASSMFITHMMYRDHIGDIDWYKEGKKQDAALSPQAQHREMIRWRDAASEASYELAILATSPSVQYEISPMFANDDEFKKGVNWLKKAAAHGYGNAEYILGLVYFNGIGVKKDKKQGFELLVRAAAHGVVNAYYSVAMIYEMKMLSNEANTEKSMYWLEKAARYGSKDAIFILAMKYADGIDVSKDEIKANELAKLDTKYHVWTKIYLTERDKFYHKYCVYKNDESGIGWSSKESGECGDEYIAHHTPDGFSEEDDDDDNNIFETAASSLDYKIDYRMAALWLKRISKIEHENTYILRSQVHHLIGCRGGLDGNKFKDIILYPDEDDDDAIDFDNNSRSFKTAMIALSDYKSKPAAVLEWLNNKAEAGDKDAMMTLGILYEHFDLSTKNKYNHKDVYEIWLSVFTKYNPLYKKLKLKQDRPKAFEYYEKLNAYEDARRVAIILGDEARQKKDIDTANAWYDKAIQISEKAYQKYIHEKPVLGGNWARKVANVAKIKGDEVKAVEWYQRALKESPETNEYNELNYAWFSALLSLAQMYDSESVAVRNQDKAVELYRTMILWIIGKREIVGADSVVYANDEAGAESNFLSFASDSERFYKLEINIILKFANIYETGTPTIPANPEEATRLRQLAVELAMTSQDLLKHIDLKAAKKAIESMPKLDLQSAVEKQILAEKGKEPYDFYIFDKLLNSCEKEFRNNGYDDIGEHESSPPLDCSMIEPAYKESIEKAVTAITTLSIASGSKHPDEIKNTFYYLAIYKGNNQQYREKLKEDSAVYYAIENYEYSTVHNMFYFSDDDINKLFYIWYLRQIPYAAKDVFKMLKAPLSWDEYMAQARARIEQDAQLREAFGYRLEKSVQTFVSTINK